MKVLDLFSGIGGFSIGLENAGFETIAFCEFDAKARLVLKKNWPDVPIYNDVRELTYERLQADGLDVDVICGGFPCQDISVAGKGAGLEGERSGLWFEFQRLIKEIRPKYAIIENVSALRTRGLEEVLWSLHEIGYDAEWHCIPASAVGAPHRRDRIWIVAYPRCTGRREQFTRDTESIGRGSFKEAIRSADTDKTSGSGSGAEVVAYPNNEWELQSERIEQKQWKWVGNCGEDVADTISQGLEGRISRWTDKERESQLGHLGCCRTAHGQSIKDQWAIEPRICRVANGIPNRTHRIKQLGNAVVPQIPEIIGLAIKHYEQERHNW